jgi:hypothetical protein
MARDRSREAERTGRQARLLAECAERRRLRPIPSVARVVILGLFVRLRVPRLTPLLPRDAADDITQDQDPSTSARHSDAIVCADS